MQNVLLVTQRQACRIVTCALAESRQCRLQLICPDSVPILSAYFVDSILQVNLSKSTWYKQLNILNEKMFVKSGMSKQKSMESQNNKLLHFKGTYRNR